MVSFTILPQDPDGWGRAQRSCAVRPFEGPWRHARTRSWVKCLGRRLIGGGCHGDACSPCGPARATKGRLRH
eukprot:15476015-Alexandrium_andersonii.AAC.1